MIDTKNNLGASIDEMVAEQEQPKPVSHNEALKKPNFTDEERLASNKKLIERHLRDLDYRGVKPYSVDEKAGQILFKDNGDHYEIMPNFSTKLGNYDIYKNGDLLNYNTDNWNRDIWTHIRDGAGFNKRR